MTDPKTATQRLRPDGWISQFWKQEMETDEKRCSVYSYKPSSQYFHPISIFPTSELEEVVEKLKNVEMQAAIQSSGWARMMSDELLSIITRLSTGRMDGGGEEG